MENKTSFAELLLADKIENKKICVVGWKVYTSKYDDNHQLSDIPYYTVDSLRKVIQGGEFLL
ncbi:hypothetical protein D3C76_1649830 [compost metagenome]